MDFFSKLLYVCVRVRRADFPFLPFLVHLLFSRMHCCLDFSPYSTAGLLLLLQTRNGFVIPSLTGPPTEYFTRSQAAHKPTNKNRTNTRKDRQTHMHANPIRVEEGISARTEGELSVCVTLQRLRSDSVLPQLIKKSYT